MNCHEINDIFDSNAPDELLVGAALAATMALQVNDGAPERTRHPEDSAPVTTATSLAEHEPLQIDANRVENAMDSNGPSDSTSLPVAAPLDPNTIVVLSVPNRYLNARRAASLELFYKELLRHLQSVPGLNVIAPGACRTVPGVGHIGERDRARASDASEALRQDSRPDLTSTTGRDALCRKIAAIRDDKNISYR